MFAKIESYIRPDNDLLEECIRKSDIFGRYIMKFSLIINDYILYKIIFL